MRWFKIAIKGNVPNTDAYSSTVRKVLQVSDNDGIYFMDSDSVAAGTGNGDIDIVLSQGTTQILKKVSFYASNANDSTSTNVITLYDGTVAAGTELTDGLHIGTIPNDEIIFGNGIALDNSTVGVRLSRAESTTVFATAWYVYN